MADIDLPEDLSSGQVLVKVHYSGIFGSQINEFDGTKGPDKFLPHLLGHEASGTVSDVGSGVKTVKKGDRVVMHWRPSNGLQSETPTDQMMRTSRSTIGCRVRGWRRGVKHCPGR